MNDFAAFERAIEGKRAPGRRITLTAGTRSPGACGRIGQDNPMAKVSNATVRQARAAYAKGETPYKIAMRLGVPRRTVRDWVSGRRRDFKGPTKSVFLRARRKP